MPLNKIVLTLQRIGCTYAKMQHACTQRDNSERRVGVAPMQRCDMLAPKQAKQQEKQQETRYEKEHSRDIGRRRGLTPRHVHTEAVF